METLAPRRAARILSPTNPSNSPPPRNRFKLTIIDLRDQGRKSSSTRTHYDHYDFLLALSDRQGSIGLEHHRSSEDGVNGSYFTDWKNEVTRRDLLPHEYTHSWNGKFRRPADLWTPDYRRPMQDSLLWVYEGQTQMWGYILGARSGLVSKEDTLAALANIAAKLDTDAGRKWRPLEDTTDDPIIAQRRPKGWRSYQRSGITTMKVCLSGSRWTASSANNLTALIQWMILPAPSSASMTAIGAK